MWTILTWVWSWLPTPNDIVGWFWDLFGYFWGLMSDKLRIDEFVDMSAVSSGVVPFVYAAGECIALPLSLIIPMKIASNVVSAAFMWGGICCTIKIILYVKGHFWSTSS